MKFRVTIFTDIFGKTFTPTKPNPAWIEAEAQLPDGRRVFAVTNFSR